MRTQKFLLSFLFVFAILFAQAQIVEKGDKILNLGLGLGTSLYSGSYISGTVPPLSASLEVIVNDDPFNDGNGAIGIGGYLGYSAFKSKYTNSYGTYGWKNSNIILGPRGYVHYNFLDNLDTYTGLLVGYWINSSSYYGTQGYSGYSSGNNYGGLTWSWFIGGRYYFSDNLAAMLELGYGVAYLNIGVALKLK